MLWRKYEMLGVDIVSVRYTVCRVTKAQNISQHMMRFLMTCAAQRFHFQYSEIAMIRSGDKGAGTYDVPGVSGSAIKRCISPLPPQNHATISRLHHVHQW